MKKKICILKNIYREGPGLIVDVLTENKIKYQIIELDRMDKIQTVDKFGAYIVPGGPASANDSNTEMINELELIRNIINERIPFLGICLGLQTMAKAKGGQVVKCLTKEVGFRDQTGKRLFCNFLHIAGYLDY
jgi:GMP synthase (glutamine-hydrolysing)